MTSILVIEDNPEIQILVEAALPDQRLRFCPSIADAEKAIKEDTFALILLDISLPDGDGLRFLASLASLPGEVPPVFILSGHSQTPNKVMAFSVGAEDFISKPFDPLELRARVSAKLAKREKTKRQGELVRSGDLTADLSRQTVFLTAGGAQEQLDLTGIEFRILMCFLREPARVFSREDLLDRAWGHAVNVTDRTVDTHVGHLRKKLGRSKAKIETVVGSGYRFQPSN
jgi:DNA-binding response OmpR family regulator